jgi:predicted O-methyltransferase YrrM
MNLFNATKEELLPKWTNMLNHCETLSEWTTGGELAWLAEAASMRHNIVEIGSYKGKSAKAMSWQCPGVIHCVDRFENSTKEILQQNLLLELASGKILLHAMESAEGAALLKDQKFDMIFIDGSHATEDVVRDIQLWKPLLASGGLFCGHDCWPTDPNNGINNALRKLNMPYTLVMDSIWAQTIS